MVTGNSPAASVPNHFCSLLFRPIFANAHYTIAAEIIALQFLHIHRMAIILKKTIKGGVHNAIQKMAVVHDSDDVSIVRLRPHQVF